MRAVGKAADVSHGLVKNFLDGDVPSEKILSKLDRWAARTGGADPAEYSAHERVADYLDRRGLRRMVRLATPRALTGFVAALYQAGVDEGWPEEEMRELEQLRRELNEKES